MVLSKSRLKIFIAGTFPTFVKFLRRMDGHFISLQDAVVSAIIFIFSLLKIDTRFLSTARGFIENKDLYSGQVKSGNTIIKYELLSPSKKIKRSIPIKSIFDSEYGNFAKYRQFITENIGIITASNLRLYGKRGWTFLTEDNMVIRDISFFLWGLDRSEIFRTLNIPHGIPVGKRVAAELEPKADNYMHWLAEATPRLKILSDLINKNGAVDKIIINHTHLPYQLETFETLNISLNDIIQWKPGAAYYADEWLIPTPTSRGGYNVSRESLETVRDLFATKNTDVSTDYPKRIYLSRKDASFRRVKNEDDVSRFLADYGFITLTLAGRSIREQALLFGNAEIVVSSDSAGLVNMVFCRPSAKIVHIYPDTYFCAIHYTLADALGLDYYYTFASGRQPQLPEEKLKDFYTDISIGIDNLRSTLELAGINKTG